MVQKSGEKTSWYGKISYLLARSCQVIVWDFIHQQNHHETPKSFCHRCFTSEKKSGPLFAAVVLSGSARTCQEGQQGISISEMAIEMAWFLAVGFGPLHSYLDCCFGKMDARWDESKGSNLEMKKRWLQEQKKGDLKLEKCWGPGVLEAVWDKSQMEKGWQNHWMMERW